MKRPKVNVPMIHYFAYGSNMDLRQMAFRCPDAVRMLPGLVSGYRFRINRHGVATLAAESGAIAHGLLWKISAADERSLDGYEGVRDGSYIKAQLPVSDMEGRSQAEALVYLATDPTPGPPRAGYLERIVSAAIAHGLPAPYIEELRASSP